MSYSESRKDLIEAYDDLELWMSEHRSHSFIEAALEGIRSSLEARQIKNIPSECQGLRKKMEVLLREKLSIGENDDQGYSYDRKQDLLKLEQERDEKLLQMIDLSVAETIASINTQATLVLQIPRKAGLHKPEQLRLF